MLLILLSLACGPGSREDSAPLVPDDTSGVEDTACTPTSWYCDADGDGWGNAVTEVLACAAPGGACPAWVADGTDCDDRDAAVSPSAVEVCDGIDDDCDGSVDEDGTDSFFADADGDGFGDPEVSSQGCVPPAGYVVDGSDCDDADPAENPDAVETCDGTDEDCDGEVDEDPIENPTTYYADEDRDGSGDPAVPKTACSHASYYVDDATDCDDADATRYPGADEACDGVDDDCDGVVDAGDLDGDGLPECRNYALTFVIDSVVTLPGTSALSFTRALTMEAWVKIPTAGTNPENGVLAKHECGYWNGSFLAVAGDRAQLYVGEDYRVDGADDLADGAWHHLAGTYDGATAALYVDGVYQGEQTVNYSTTNTYDWHVGGACSYPTSLVGLIDEVMVWSVARSASEVLADMAAPPAAGTPGLEIQLLFDEGTGQVAADSSGNGRDGVLGDTSSVDPSDPVWVEDGP